MDQAHKMSAHSYTSKNPKSEANLKLFKSGEIDKLSCVLQLSEGVNIPGLRAGIIMHSYGNERKSSQRIGRLLRLNPTDTATMHMLCYTGTIDERWTANSLEDFDKTKITYQ
jgi:superfamily II DNA or RNA helicase